MNVKESFIAAIHELCKNRTCEVCGDIACGVLAIEKYKRKPCHACVKNEQIHEAWCSTIFNKQCSFDNVCEILASVPYHLESIANLEVLEIIFACTTHITRISKRKIEDFLKLQHNVIRLFPCVNFKVYPAIYAHHVAHNPNCTFRSFVYAVSRHNTIWSEWSEWNGEHENYTTWLPQEMIEDILVLVWSKREFIHHSDVWHTTHRTCLKPKRVTSFFARSSRSQFMNCVCCESVEGAVMCFVVWLRRKIEWQLVGMSISGLWDVRGLVS